MSPERSDPELLRLAERFVAGDDVVWDIGANVGIFTFAAAARSGTGGKVLAIEPDATLVRLLRRSALTNQERAAEVEIIEAAVSDVSGTVDLLVSARGRSRNRIASVDGPDLTRYRQTVRTVTLDQLCDTHSAPNVVKIDVEGAEERVLLGAHRLLTRIRPIVLCEVSWSRTEAVLSILASHSYVLFDGERPEGGFFKATQAPTYSTIAIPAEHASEFTLR